LPGAKAMSKAKESLARFDLLSMLRSRLTRGENMSDCYKRRLRASLLLPLLLAALSADPLPLKAHHRETLRQRSIYVPVRFLACPHVKSVRLRMAGSTSFFPLGLRTFLFTYDVGTEALQPGFVEVLIDAEGICELKAIRRNVLITPLGMASSNKVVEANLDALYRQARVRRDVRFPERRVLIRCSGSCDQGSVTTADTQLLHSGPERVGLHAK